MSQFGLLSSACRRLAGFALGLSLAGSAIASPMEINNSRFEVPLGMRVTSDMEGAVPSRRDDNFNRTVVQRPGGEFAATAIGNLVSVQMQGSNNTVIVNAQQINQGNQRASLGVQSLGSAQ